MAEQEPTDVSELFRDFADHHPWHLPPVRDSEAEAMLATIYGPQAEVIAKDLVNQLAAAFPQTGKLGDELQRDILDKARITLTRAIQLLADSQSFEELGPVIEEVARRRRRQQISQEIIFAGYRYLPHLIFERVTEEVRDHPQGRRLIDAVAQRQLEFQWMVSRHVAAAFDTGPEALAASREESVQGVLEILAGQRPGDGKLEEHAARFGLLMPLDHVAVTVPGAPGARPTGVDLPGVRPAARANPWSVVGGLNGRIVVVGRGTPRGLPGPWGGVRLTGDALRRPELMAEHIAWAGQTADTAARLGLPSADADQVAPFTAVAALSPERQQAFLASCFGDLHISPRGAPILQAVAESARSSGRREAAGRLRVHPNTLDYRLARFKELTGINLSDPLQRLRCDLGLFLLGMLRP